MKLLRLLILPIILLAVVTGTSNRVLPETVNELECGSNQIEVRFLGCEKKSDASLLLIRTEKGTEVVVVDGGLANGVCTQELLSLRESWLREAGLEEETENKDLKLHIILVVTHCHVDHVRELTENILPSEYLAVDTLHIGEESALPEKYKEITGNQREPLMEAMALYAPDTPVNCVPFNASEDFALSYGTATLFAPNMDYGSEEGMELIKELYYPEDTEEQLKKDMSVGVLNSNSMWLKVSVPGASVLFPGDTMKRKTDRTDEPMDEMIARYGNALQADIVKYPHHGVKRNEAAENVAQKLLKENGIVVLTGPESSQKGGKALEPYGVNWITTEERDQIFILSDTGWKLLTMEN